jgi:hypothetical protein
MEASGVGVVGEKRRARGWCVGVGIGRSGVELRGFREHVLDDARDGELGLQPPEDAEAGGGVGARAGAAAVAVVSRVGATVRSDGTGPVELREHGGGHSDIGATVEELVDAAAEMGRPSYRDGEVADGRAAALCEDGVDDLLSVSDGMGVVVGVEVGEIADEELVIEAELGCQGLDEVVVGVDAAREDES